MFEVMETSIACRLFKAVMKEHPKNIERCSTGIGNYVFIVSTTTTRYVLRCSKEINVYNNTVHWLSELQVCNIPIPRVLDVGRYENYEYLILSYAEGKDIGEIYSELTDVEKSQIAKEVIAIQKSVSMLNVSVTEEWSWNSFVNELLERSYKLISVNNYFEVSRVDKVRCIQEELQEYLSLVKPIPYLDDISTKNLIINNGSVSSVIDIDWIGIGDVLTFVALTKVALLNMGLDTKYVDYLLGELHPNTEQYKAFIFYCLLFCVDFMGERGTQFLDKMVPVNQEIIDRLNRIYDELMMQWSTYNSNKYKYSNHE